MSTGSIECSLAYSREATRGCVGSERDRQIARVHGATIPLQPEAHLPLPHSIVRQHFAKPSD
ncbi:MAG: hypothetical protein ACXVCM_13935 [Ktedonobacteraceae bacterium]